MIARKNLSCALLGAAMPMAITGVSLAGGTSSGWELELGVNLPGAVPAATDISGSQAIVGSSSGPSASATVFERLLDGTWDQGVTLQRPTGVGNYGFDVAIDDDVAVVGAPSGGGQVVIYERGAAGEWGPGVVLDNPGGGAQFGYAVDIEDGTILVGAPTGQALGRAHVLAQDEAGEWQATQVLRGKNGTIFGTSVGLSGDSAVVGAPGNFSGAFFGSADLFVRDSTGNWLADSVFTYPNVSQLGSAVSLDADTLVVGAPGSAIVWERDDAGWDEGTPLPGNNPLFGTAVAVGGDQILIGVPTGGAGNVASYVRGDDGVWGFNQNLPGIGFGSVRGQSVAISADLAVVGANGAFGIYAQSDCPGADCLADLNCDGVVDGADLNIMLGDWGLMDSPANISGEGPVDGSDLTILLGEWGPCP
jgi:hypothetical protein